MFHVHLDIRECGDKVIVLLRGELDIADAADVTAALVTAAVLRKTIVDLAGLAFIDCSGAAALVRAHRRVHRAGGTLLLAAPQRRVLRVFELSGLIDGLRIHASVAQAAGFGDVSGMAADGATGRPGRTA